MKPLQASLALAVAALTATGALRAQTPEPSAVPTAAAPAPVATLPPKPAKEQKVSKKMLEKYDTNKNGVLDPDERAEFEKDAPARKAEKLKKYDKNGDGQIDENEKIQMRIDKLREADAERKANKNAPDKQ